MIILMIIGSKFDLIELHLLIETLVWINHVITYSKHIRKSIPQNDDPFLNQPDDSHQKWHNPKQMIMLIIIGSNFDPIELHLLIETPLWLNNLISHKDTLQYKQCLCLVRSATVLWITKADWFPLSTVSNRHCTVSSLSLILFPTLEFAGRVTQ